MAEAIAAASFVETSSLTMHNVGEVFAQAARVSLTYQQRRGKWGRGGRRSGKITAATSALPPSSSPSKASLSRRRCLIQ